MARVSFKAKVQNGRIKVPKLTRAHCDMNAMRAHPQLGAYANSDLFEGILHKRTRMIGTHINLESIPHFVTVDASGFLAVVSFEV